MTFHFLFCLLLEYSTLLEHQSYDDLEDGTAEVLGARNVVLYTTLRTHIWLVINVKQLTTHNVF